MATREKDLYAPVATWLKESKGCFKTGINTGLKMARIDVVGIRDAGGNLSSSPEMIAVEVKRAATPFGNAVGQSVGYSVYADRCYFADLKVREPFTEAEIQLAGHLGVGLLAITGPARQRVVSEILAAPFSPPIEHLRLEVIEKLGLSVCSICRSMFSRGDSEKWARNIERKTSARARLKEAIENEKGIAYWLWNQHDPAVNSQNYRRRYVCPDCLWGLFSELV